MVVNVDGELDDIQWPTDDTRSYGPVVPCRVDAGEQVGEGRGKVCGTGRNGPGAVGLSLSVMGQDRADVDRQLLARRALHGDGRQRDGRDVVPLGRRQPLLMGTD